MALRLGDLLLEKGLITEVQLKEGLRAQQLFGGRLGTNLVELGYVSEMKLAQLLSEQLQIPNAQAGDFDNVPQDARDAIGADLVEKYRVVPIGLDKRKLRLAMADPTDLRLIDDIAFRTGCTIQPVVAPEVLIAYGMERLYGIARKNRYLRLAGAATGDFQVVQTGRSAAGARELPPLQPAGEGAPGVQIEDRAEFFDIDNEEFTSTGGYTLEDAAKALVEVKDHAEVFEVLRRFLASRFVQCVVFVFRGEHAYGWTQHGCRITDEQARQVALPWAKSVLFNQVLRARAPYVGAPPASEIDLRLLGAFGIPGRTELLCAPVLVNDQPVCIAVGAGALGRSAADVLAEFDALARKTSYAFQIIFLRQRILAAAE